MQLIVRGNQTHVVEVDSDNTVLALKLQLSLLENVDLSAINLFCSGAPVEDEVNVSCLEGQTLDLTVPLKGGKVHGSLARAGKVRGQTPKVEAGEKKKKKTGRAKRRIQYVRCCFSGT
jgi:small subunit ribosomal protein S30e